MSWTQRASPYNAYTTQAQNVPTLLPHVPWELDVWEVNDEYPRGYRRKETSAAFLQTKAELRIIYAPVDIPNRDALRQTTQLLHLLNVPGSFTTERTQASCHAFGRQTENNGWCSWFHFLLKNIDLKYGTDGKPEIRNRAAELRYHAPPTLPFEDYSWNHSAFFLRADNDKRVTLVCFGALPQIKTRLDEFISSGSWKDVASQPYTLFDLVLEGLYFEVDNALWRMSKVFGPLEHSILKMSSAPIRRRKRSETPFPALHNCAKYIIYLTEALESCVMVIDEVRSRISAEATNTTPSLVDIQLKERLEYRRSVFRSTQLRHSSLQKRTDNAINLSFNLVTQQDSLLMMQDSNTMKFIAAITMVFLPTTGVAAVIGSQLLVSTYKEGKWDIVATPLFWTTWWISIPLTVFVIIFAALWHFWTHPNRPGRGGSDEILTKLKSLRTALAKDY